MEYLLVIILAYSNKCGVQYKTESIATFKTEALCRQQGERLEAMYMRTHSNFKELVWDCKQQKETK